MGKSPSSSEPKEVKLVMAAKARPEPALLPFTSALTVSVINFLEGLEG